MELEYKWDASSRGTFKRFVKIVEQNASLHCSAPQILRITDYYLDTSSQDFSRQKIALRIRRVCGKYEVTLKSRSRVKEGLARRQEKTYPLPQANSLKGALLQLKELSFLKKITQQPLIIRFSILNVRTIYVLRQKNTVCEAALDNYVIHACGKRKRRKEIELELKQGTETNFQKLAEKLCQLGHFSAVEKSKVASAEQMLVSKN